MNLKDKLKTLPKKPGCYLMKDKTDTVIYVGKAVNLFNRVNSYFMGAHDYKTTKMVSNINDFDYIVVNSEKEALILEYNLIKKYDPKFNIVFKDDKSYPYILLKDSKEPCVEVVRLKKKSKFKGKLFGPYPDVLAARNMVDYINKIFPTRKCHNIQKDLCLYYHIGACLGYCKYDVDENICLDFKNKIIKFLNGDSKDVISELKSKMLDCSNKLEFEKAQEYKVLIDSLKQTLLKQNVQKYNYHETFDVFNYYVQDGYICIIGLFVVNGRLLNIHKFIDYLVGDSENFVSSYLYQYYLINNNTTKLYVPKSLLGYLQDNLNLEVLSVTKGYKYQLIKQSELNAKEYLNQNKKMILRKNNYYDNLNQDFIELFNKEIKRIELFDNSHISGTNTVAAMVVYKDFKPSKKDYRLYKLEDSANDLKSMSEVMYRRYFRVLSDNLERPDLIIVDGAKTQIEEAKKILDSLNLDITLVGLGKDNHHNTSYLMNDKFEVINIEKRSDLFYFLANAQDEVHRFAITYHKKLRTKNTYKSILNDVPGLGPKTKTKLLRKYKSLANIKTLELSELESVLNKNVALSLYNKLREEDA